MAVQFDAATALTYNQLIQRVRDFTGDEDSTAANQRWSDARIAREMNDELRKMYIQMGLSQSTGAISSVNLTYTASSQSVALPEQASTSPIVRVEDITNSSLPVPLSFVPQHDIEKYNNTRTDVQYYTRVWTVLDEEIAVRPVNDAAITLRIWTMRVPYILDGAAASTDQSPIMPGLEELITLGAAIRLLEVDDELTPVRLARYVDLWGRFLAVCTKFKGPQMVRNNRRYR